MTVLDRLNRAGGRGSSVTQQGHRFDLGPPIVTVPQVLEELWAACGRDFRSDVDLRPLDHFYQIRWEEGSQFAASGETARMPEEVKRLSPGDLPGYRKFLKDSEARYWFGFESLGRRPMGSLWGLIKVLPRFAMLRADRSVARHAALRVRDERRRMALSFHPLFIGGDAQALALARACDLGLAMQLTNIARDVGEDARAGRLFLPLDCLDQAGIEPDGFAQDPQATPAVRRMVARLLAEADRFYVRSKAGIAALPRPARMGIWAARLIHAGIGGQVRRQRCDSISRRAHTSRSQKLGWMAQPVLRSATGALMPRSAVIFAPSLPETRFLVEAAAARAPQSGRTKTLLDVLTVLRRREMALGTGRQRVWFR